MIPEPCSIKVAAGTHTADPTLLRRVERHGQQVMGTGYNQLTEHATSKADDTWTLVKEAADLLRPAAALDAVACLGSHGVLLKASRSWQQLFAVLSRLSAQAQGGDEEARLCGLLLHGGVAILCMVAALFRRLRNVGRGTAALVLLDEHREVFRKLSLFQSSKALKDLLRELAPVFRDSEEVEDPQAQLNDHPGQGGSYRDGQFGAGFEDDDPFGHSGERYMLRKGLSTGHEFARLLDFDEADAIMGALATAVGERGLHSDPLSADLTIHDFRAVQINLDDIRPRKAEGPKAGTRAGEEGEKQEDDDSGEHFGRRNREQTGPGSTPQANRPGGAQPMMPAPKRKGLKGSDVTDVVTAEDVAEQEEVERILANVSLSLDAAAIRNLIETDKSDVVDIVAKAGRRRRGDNNKVRGRGRDRPA